MSRLEKELDEFGKKSIAPLQPAPPLAAEVKAQERAKFLLHGENLRASLIPGADGVKSKRSTGKTDGTHARLFFPLYKIVIVVVVLLLLVAGSSFTVYAAQSSLPGDPLYTVKSAGEDIRLTLTVSPEARLNLTLDYTNRRISEIKTLASHGKYLSDQASDRYQSQLDGALQLAAQMDDQQLEIALSEIKFQAENQGMTIQELIARLPDQASPAIIHLQQRLQEQVQLSTFGEENPQQFRKEIKERAQNRHGPKKTTASDEPGETPILASPMPSGQNSSNGNGEIQPTSEPGNGNPGNGQGQPGNGNHGPNPTHTPHPQ